MGLTVIPAFASNGIGDVFTSTESFSSPKNERVIILNEAFPEASVAPGVKDKKKSKANNAVEQTVKPQQTSSRLTPPKHQGKAEEPKSEVYVEKTSTASVASPVQVQAPAQSYNQQKPVAPQQTVQNQEPQINDYQIMSNMQRELQRLKMIEQIAKVQTNIQKQQAETDKVKKDAIASDLMNMRLGPPGKGSMELPVIPASQVAAPAPQKPATDTNGEPVLRVVGIQGFDGVFSAQILNNGGLTAVDVGTEIEGGIKVIAIDENGVKVKRKHTRDGKTSDEIISLPFSK